ncbi:hypothetical protein CARUB_v10006147mg [Capsella rubella]|uniref:Uncharacterized protein n=1 Tax=Capsella rubella TaxID=81985 RepID=R0GLJ8_9BRAS|nr:hypothetical protein CARUB_v10006147mg [Capsella rubella]
MKGGGEVERTERAIIIQRNDQAKASTYHFGKLGPSFSLLTSMHGSSPLISRSSKVPGDFESTPFSSGIDKKQQSITTVHTTK